MASNEARSRSQTIIWDPAREAVTHHWAPLLLIQICAVVMVVLYYQLPSMRAGLDWLGHLKERGGLVFAFLVGCNAGGIVPEIAKLLTGKLKRMTRAWLLESLFNGLVYGLVGVQVVVFYWFQTVWFGPGHDFVTLAIKTAVDMLVFSPLISIPTAVLLLDWRAVRFKFGPLNLGAFLWNRLLPSLILCWIFWTPVLFCVYSLPSNLQFPFSNLAEAAWAIVFIFFNAESNTSSAAP